MKRSMRPRATRRTTTASWPTSCLQRHNAAPRVAQRRQGVYANGGAGGWIRRRRSSSPTRSMRSAMTSRPQGRHHRQRRRVQHGLRAKSLRCPDGPIRRHLPLGRAASTVAASRRSTSQASRSRVRTRSRNGRCSKARCSRTFQLRPGAAAGESTLRQRTASLQRRRSDREVHLTRNPKFDPLQFDPKK